MSISMAPRWPSWSGSPGDSKRRSLRAVSGVASRVPGLSGEQYAELPLSSPGKGSLAHRTQHTTSSRVRRMAPAARHPSSMRTLNQASRR